MKEDITIYFNSTSCPGRKLISRPANFTYGIELHKQGNVRGMDARSILESAMAIWNTGCDRKTCKASFTDLPETHDCYMRTITMEKS